jgi:flagellar assembly factor FliW
MSMFFTEVARPMQSIQTTRFGRVEVERERVVLFPDGVLGFPEHKKYLFVEHKPGSPFLWLQSLDAPELAFVIINPLLIRKDYLDQMSPAERRHFEGALEGRTLLFVLVTIPPGEAEKMTVNLMGPLVIDADARVGRQVILANSSYSHQYPLVST